MHISPYLFFNGQCDAAMAFYEEALGAKRVFVMRYKESPAPVPEVMTTPEYENWIMHANLTIEGNEVMCSDGMPDTNGGGFSNFSLSITVDSLLKARTIFSALAKEGTVLMPLSETFFSPCYGMLKDKFGVGWLVYVTGGAA